MASKQLFYESISKDTVYDEEFYKRVYGYSVCDDLFITAVSTKLCSIGRKDAIQGYNEWFARWQEEYNQMMKGVAEKYREECERQYLRMQKEKQEKVIKKCHKVKTWEAITTLLNYQLE
jgi:hypothetical protein